METWRLVSARLQAYNMQPQLPVCVKNHFLRIDILFIDIRYNFVDRSSLLLQLDCSNFSEFETSLTYFTPAEFLAIMWK